MEFDVRVFARNAEGELKVFDASRVISYKEAINIVKRELGAPRALCLAYSKDNAQ